jgi:hypothetical protein
VLAWSTGERPALLLPPLVVVWGGTGTGAGAGDTKCRGGMACASAAAVSRSGVVAVTTGDAKPTDRLAVSGEVRA